MEAKAIIRMLFIRRPPMSHITFNAPCKGRLFRLRGIFACLRGIFALTQFKCPIMSTYVSFFQIQCPFFNILFLFFTFYITFQCPMCKCPLIIVLVMPLKSYLLFSIILNITFNAPSVQFYFQLSLFHVMPDVCHLIRSHN